MMAISMMARRSSSGYWLSRADRRRPRAHGRDAWNTGDDRRAVRYENSAQMPEAMFARWSSQRDSTPVCVIHQLKDRRYALLYKSLLNVQIADTEPIVMATLLYPASFDTFLSCRRLTLRLVLFAYKK